MSLRSVIILQIIVCVLSKTLSLQDMVNDSNNSQNNDFIKIPLTKIHRSNNRQGKKINLRERRSPFRGKSLLDDIFGLDNIFDPRRIFEHKFDDDFGFDIPIRFPPIDLLWPFHLPHRRHFRRPSANGVIGNDGFGNHESSGSDDNLIPDNDYSRPTSKVAGNRVYLKNNNDAVYTGPISIGDKKHGKQFLVVFDTGSSDIWVPSIRCTTNFCARRNRYDSSVSDDYREDGRRFKVTYGSGKVFGFTSIDTIKIGNLSIENQVFGEVMFERGPALSNAQFDGIFGMGFPSISATQKKSPLDRLYNDGRIKRRMFCFILHHQNNEPTINDQSIGGEIQIGGCEFNSTVNLPLTSIGYWQFRMSGVFIEKENRKLFRGCPGGCEAIMDTGTSLITGPSDEVDAINEILGAKKDEDTGEWMIDCINENGISSLPHVTFAMGDGLFTLTAAEYIVQIDDSLCMSGFMSLDTVDIGPSWIIGDVFIRTQVVIFDMDKRRIGLATK